MYSGTPCPSVLGSFWANSNCGTLNIGGPIKLRGPAFARNSTERSVWPIAFRVSRSFKVIGTDTDRSAICDFLLTFNSSRGPISYRFRDNRLFQSKIAKFSTPVYLTPHWRGSLGIEYRRLGSKKLEWRTTGPRKKFDDIFCRLDTIHERDGRQRPRLRIASRGKSVLYFCNVRL